VYTIAITAPATTLNFSSFPQTVEVYGTFSSPASQSFTLEVKRNDGPWALLFSTQIALTGTEWGPYDWVISQAGTYTLRATARSGSRDYTATRTVTVNGSTSSLTTRSSNKGYPAAPAIAARLLKEAGVKPKHAGGNYISDVARLMTKNAAFMGVKKNHSSYESKVRWYLRSVNALP
jgi:hypothetical protein